MSKYAIFICSNEGYLPFLNACLNSIDRWKLDVDVHLLHYDFPQKYIDDASEKFNFNLIPTEIKRDEFNIHEFNEKNNNLFIKQSRFKYIREQGLEYDAICMLDADMFVCTHNLMNMFDLVKGTDKLIACNERFKWTFDRKYTFEGKPIFDNPVRALKFHCSVPIICDLNQWTEVFDYYNHIAYNAFELGPEGKPAKSIGDMYCWNISVYKNSRQNDVILFPMETMTQVHCRYGMPWARLQRQFDSTWMTYAGDEVFLIHGRMGTPNWMKDEIARGEKALKEMGVTAPKAFKELTDTLNAVKNEWKWLNFNHKMDLTNYSKDPQKYRSI